MSIHRTTVILCDICGHVEETNGETTGQRTTRGWDYWRDPETGSFRHSCPKCTEEIKTDTYVC